jgi:hypothetical protein
MAEYRLYCLDGLGHLSLADWIEAEDDVHAVKQARKMKDGALRCEVWQGKRLVARLNHHDWDDRT